MTEPVVLSAKSAQDLIRAAQLLREGGVVAVPTDTFYGLAASIYQPEAVSRVFRIKRRPLERQVPILLASAADLPLVTASVPHNAWRLINQFWPGRLTLVLPVRATAPNWLTASGSTVGARVPGARASLELLASLGEPIVGTSANVSGAAPSTQARDVLDQIGDGLDAILVDDSASVVAAPSTVVEIRGDRAVLHREGAIGIECIREALGPGTYLIEQLTDA